ncbi:MAG TPA: hypothetical protein VH092_34525 [Urbifossiella sp.]|nr:hypothetical protein [Urbifossiella sp.]
MLTPRADRPSRVFAVLVPALAAAALVAGCGESTGGKLLPVQGKVIVDDKPLTKGSVRFVPDTSRGNTDKHEPAGEIGGDGLYVITTGGKIGAPAGWYKVGIISADTPDSTKPLDAKSYVGKKYNDAQTSGLTIEVVAAPTPGAYDLKASLK